MDLKDIAKAYRELQDPPLDDSQRHFCSLPAKYIRMLAPAGSGKTYSLLHRCKFLLEKEKARKPSFLVFTFTRAARDELLRRLHDGHFTALKGHTTITTLNAFGNKFIRSQKRHLKLITSSTDKFYCVNNALGPVWEKHERIKQLVTESRHSVRLLDLIDYLKSLGFRHDNVATVAEFRHHIEQLESWKLTAHVHRLLKELADLQLLTPLPSANGFDSLIEQAYESFVKFWVDACTSMYQMATFTLEDQKYWARILIEDSHQSNMPRSILPRCSHILVDEFQDVNPLDLLLLKALREATDADLTIVGDDDQAIFEWRSATPEFILAPEQHFNVSFNTCVLSRNYRCPRNIVEMSQRLIRHNHRRVDKEVTPVLKSDARIELLSYASANDAYDQVLDRVLDLLRTGQIKNAALVGRKRSQIVPYQIICASRDIDFCAAEDLNVFLSSAFQELMDMLAIRGRLRRDVAWEFDPVDDVLKLCDKVKKYPLNKNDKKALRSFLKHAGGVKYEDIIASLGDYRGPLKGKNDSGDTSRQFAGAISKLLRAETVREALIVISNSFAGLQKDYGKALEDIFYTDPPFLHLADYARRYGDDFEAFLRDLERAKDSLENFTDGIEEEAEAVSEAWRRPLHLMTALRAKGKEFDAVVVLDANEGIWPSCLAQSPDEYEQERRLFYVSVTRVRKYLFFVINDRIADRIVTPSRFLYEMGAMQ